MEAFMGNLVPMVFFATVFGIIYIFVQARNRERLALIERGADASIFESGSSKLGMAIKLGMFLAGAGLGILLGDFIDTYLHLSVPIIGKASMLLMLGGSALVASHFLIKSLERKGML